MRSEPQMSKSSWAEVQAPVQETWVDANLNVTTGPYIEDAFVIQRYDRLQRGGG